MDDTAPRVSPADSLAVRLILFAVLLVVVTAALIGGLAYTRARHALEREARTRLTIIARNVAQSLDREIADRESDLASWAHLAVMRAVMYDDVDKELAQFIRQILTGGQAYVGILCLDAGHRVVASVGDISAVVLAGSDSDDRTRLSPIRVSLVPGPNTLDRLLQFQAAVFNPERAEQTIGALVVLIDPRRLLRAAETALGTKGTHLSFELRVRDGGRPSNPTTGSSGGPPDEALIGAAPISHGVLEGKTVDVVVSQPVAEALAAVTSLRTALLKRVSIVLLLSTILGAFVAWRIGKPIRRLTATVHGITERGLQESEWDLRTTGGEVGVLASAFRAMMERLAVAQAEAVMQSRLALLGEIAANVAHEVRNPLSILKTSAQLLARRELPLSEQDELASVVTAEVDRLNAVVTDLVDLARPKRTTYGLQSLPDVVRHAAAFFATMALKQGVEIDTRIAADVLLFYGSADQIYQVLLNLIHNALQALSPPGRIVIRCNRAAGWIVLDVEDTGPGFAAEILPKAFTRFFTTKADGTGLGLAISRRIVEEHGGTIVAENIPGGGARVRLRLRAREQA
jgi:two-component system sensor histidine kinase HydH